MTALLDGANESRSISKPGKLIMPGTPIVLALRAHRRNQHSVQLEAGHSHGRQIHRDLEEKDQHERLSRHQGARNRRAQAQHDHCAAEPRRTEVPEADAAHHRSSGYAREHCRHPVARRKTNQRPIADAAAPGNRKHQVDVSRRSVMLQRSATGNDQHSEP